LKWVRVPLHFRLILTPKASYTLPVISHLRIKDLALLQELSIDLPREFIAITGETGAGKSVLVGALKFLAGARADKGIIREGADSCEVEAALNFPDSSAVDRLLASLQLPPCEDGQMIIFRNIGLNKPSKITVNGQLTSLSALQQIGTLWLEYNSPEAVLELYTPAEQLALLDNYAQLDKTAYLAAYENYRKAAERYESAKGSEKLSPDEIEFLMRQLEKIDQLRLSAQSVENLEAEYKRLGTLEDEMNLSNQIVETLGAARKIQTVVGRARGLAAQNPQYKSLSDRLESLVIELDDQESCWRQIAGKCDLSPAERDVITQRMGEWMELKRRHVSLDGVMAHREMLADKLQLQQNLDSLLEQFEKEMQTHLKVVSLEQQKLLKSRRAAAESLIGQALPLLKKLGMPKAEMAGNFAPTEPDRNGGCAFELVFNANPGQSMKPLAQIASSGELARVMLSLKAALIRAASKPVIVFDEVDANVGGEVAASVAELLARLGAVSQVFCITHLPQVACKANFHLVVRKSAVKGQTSVSIEAISDVHKRLEELARMLGDRNAATALEHAKALLGK